MALDPDLFQIIDEQKALVLALEDPEVTESAKTIAFYSALIDAAPEDFADPKDQEELLTYLRKCLAEELETYMDITDKLL